MSWIFFILINILVGFLFFLTPIDSLLKQIFQIQKESVICLRNKKLEDAEKQALLFQKTKALFASTLKLSGFILLVIAPIFIGFILSSFWSSLEFGSKLNSMLGIVISLLIFILIYFSVQRHGKK
jgi:hypothetical protein